MHKPITLKPTLYLSSLAPFLWCVRVCMHLCHRVDHTPKYLLSSIPPPSLPLFLSSPPFPFPSPHHIIPRLASVHEICQQDGILGARKATGGHSSRALLHCDSLVVPVHRLCTHRQVQCVRVDLVQGCFPHPHITSFMLSQFHQSIINDRV